jgi:hypothetical protein
MEEHPVPDPIVDAVDNQAPTPDDHPPPPDPPSSCSPSTTMIIVTVPTSGDRPVSAAPSAQTCGTRRIMTGKEEDHATPRQQPPNFHLRKTHTTTLFMAPRV